MLLFHTIADSGYNEKNFNLRAATTAFFKQNLVAKRFPGSVVNTTMGQVLPHFPISKKHLEITSFRYLRRIYPNIDIANFCNIPSSGISGIENEVVVKHTPFPALKMFPVCLEDLNSQVNLER